MVPWSHSQSVMELGSQPTAVWLQSPLGSQPAWLQILPFPFTSSGTLDELFSLSLPAYKLGMIIRM